MSLLTVLKTIACSLLFKFNFQQPQHKLIKDANRNNRGCWGDIRRVAKNVYLAYVFVEYVDVGETITLQPTKKGEGMDVMMSETQRKETQSGRLIGSFMKKRPSSRTACDVSVARTAQNWKILVQSVCFSSWSGPQRAAAGQVSLQRSLHAKGHYGFHLSICLSIYTCRFLHTLIFFSPSLFIHISLSPAPPFFSVSSFLSPVQPSLFSPTFYQGVLWKQARREVRQHWFID